MWRGLRLLNSSVPFDLSFGYVVFHGCIIARPKQSKVKTGKVELTSLRC